MLSRLPTYAEVRMDAAKKQARAESAVREEVAKRLARTVNDAQNVYHSIVLLDIRDILIRNTSGFKSVTAAQVTGSMRTEFYFRLAYEIGVELIEAGWPTVISGVWSQVGLHVSRMPLPAFPYRLPRLIAVQSEALMAAALRNGSQLAPDAFMVLPTTVPPVNVNIYNNIPSHWSNSRPGTGARLTQPLPSPWSTPPQFTTPALRNIEEDLRREQAQRARERAAQSLANGGWQYANRVAEGEDVMPPSPGVRLGDTFDTSLVAEDAPIDSRRYIEEINEILSEGPSVDQQE